MARTVATILREIDQVKRSGIKEDLKTKFVAQLEAELDMIGRAIAGPTGDQAAPPPAPKPPK